MNNFNLHILQHLLLLGPSFLVLRFEGCGCSFLAPIHTCLIPSTFIAFFQFCSMSIALSTSLAFIYYYYYYYCFDDVGLAFLS